MQAAVVTGHVGMDAWCQVLCILHGTASLTDIRLGSVGGQSDVREVR